MAWKRVNLFGEDLELITKALKMSMEFIETTCDVIPTIDLVEESFQIALKENISLYDSLFIGASQRENIPLLTLDERLKNTQYMVELL